MEKSNIMYFIRITPAEKRKKGVVSFNDVLNTFYLYLYGVRHMVNGHGDSGGAKVGRRARGRQFRSQMYFNFTNRGAHIYLVPGGNTPLLRHCKEIAKEKIRCRHYNLIAAYIPNIHSLLVVRYYAQVGRTQPLFENNTQTIL